MGSRARAQVVGLERLGPNRERGRWQGAGTLQGARWAGLARGLWAGLGRRCAHGPVWDARPWSYQDGHKQSVQ